MLKSCPATLAGRGLAALCLLTTSIVSSALGELIAISGSPWYSAYARLSLTRLGLTPTEDQQPELGVNVDEARDMAAYLSSVPPWAF
jgi:hypothetical protein